MSARQRGGGDPGHHPGAAAQIPAPTKKLDHAQDTAPPPGQVVAAVAYGPSPGRTLWHYAAGCPAGHGVHMHRAGPPRPEGYTRTAPCGREYVIVARTVLPMGLSWRRRGRTDTVATRTPRRAPFRPSGVANAAAIAQLAGTYRCPRRQPPRGVRVAARPGSVPLCPRGGSLV